MYRRFSDQPKSIFLLDFVGAIVTIFFLRIVLVQLNHLVGIPLSTLNLLVIFPIGFAVLDLVGYVFFKNIGVQVLKLLILLNLLYCTVSVYHGFLNTDSITFLGWTYLIIEILIISFVVGLEYRILKLIGSTRDTD